MYAQTNNYMKSASLGRTEYYYPEEPWLGSYEVPDAVEPTAPSTKWWETAINVVKTALPVVKDVVKTSPTNPSTPTYPGGSGGGSAPTPKPGMSTGIKVAIGVAAAAVVGGGGYLAFRKGSKKKAKE